MRVVAARVHDSGVPAPIRRADTGSPCVPSHVVVQLRGSQALQPRCACSVHTQVTEHATPVGHPLWLLYRQRIHVRPQRDDRRAAANRGDDPMDSVRVSACQRVSSTLHEWVLARR